MTSVAWLRRDLRLDDNPALTAALAEDDEVVPLFVRDPALAGNIAGRSRRMDRLDAALVDLDHRLRSVGGRLIVRMGRPEEVLPAVVREVGARRVHAARDVTPYAIRRDDAVGRAVPLVLHPGLLIVEPDAIGERRVFAAFHRRWLGAELRRTLHEPRKVRVPDVITSAPLSQVWDSREPDPLDRARAFAMSGAAGYAADLAVWRDGNTGFPTVDAAMRQLGETGWIANRARLIAASFLTRELFLDWRLGARYFMQTLVDGDVANNVCNWRWVAGVGTDAAPYFRILDPTRQGQRFDPHGAWVRRWVPELRGVPDAFVHRPWDAPGGPPAAYASRIVDRAMARKRVLSEFRAARHFNDGQPNGPGTRA